jgi:hypothetical protein
LVLLAGSPIPAQAGLVLSIADATVPEGGTGTLDVYLSSTAPSNMPDQFNNYAFTLQITPTTVGNLAFSNNQSFGYLNSSNYVFFGNSADYIAGLSSPPPFGGTPLTSVYANDSFLGFDSTNDLIQVSLSSNSGKVLLASLTLDGSITSVGESFTVSLVPGSGDGSSSTNPNMYFNTVDRANNQVSFVSFDSSSGTVTITPAASVPEPGSMISGLIAVLLLSACRAQSRLTQRKSSAIR